MNILAIETSCDETAISIVAVDKSGDTPTFKVLANETLSQIELHAQYGGVFPKMAKREHEKALVPLLLIALEKANLKNSHVGSSKGTLTPENIRRVVEAYLPHERELGEVFLREAIKFGTPPIDAVAVTRGPGLEPALWVGINFAQSLADLWSIPLYAVNHMEGHVLAALYKEDVLEKGIFPEIKFPVLSLLISGGHTELVRMDDWGAFNVLGETQDDAVGEAFDKVARMLGLPYPGGPEIARLAEGGTPKAYTLPRPMIHSKDLNFSFAGLKTSVLYLVKKLGELTPQMRADIAREFEDACIEVLTAKTGRALELSGASALIVGGGVSANLRIRASLQNLCDTNGIMLYVPQKGLSTDNALMIALAGAFKTESTVLGSMRAEGGWSISSL